MNERLLTDDRLTEILRACLTHSGVAGRVREEQDAKTAAAVDEKYKPLVEALEFAKAPSGAYSRDRIQYLNNVIQAIQDKAAEALAQLGVSHESYGTQDLA